MNNIEDKEDLINNDPSLAEFVFSIVPRMQPVDLLYFRASTNAQSVEISWASLKAWDFNHFELERSTDGRSFQYLATIDAE